MRNLRPLGLGAILALVLLVIPAGCSSPTNISVTEKTPLVRVRVLENQEQVLLASNGSPTLQSSNERAPRRLDFPRGMGVSVTLQPDGWRVGAVAIPPGELTVQPQYVGSVSVNGAAYRGRYRFVPTASNRFDVINDVDLDSYLASVVRGELPENWHPETYKAQAIVARTYALYESHTAGSNRYYDIEHDQRSQVYNGISSETNKSRQAVNDTAGVVVAYGPKGQEKIFKAYFSSCCGGEGQSAYEAFGEPDIPPLRGKFVGALCSASPRFNWGPVIIKKDELTRRIRIWGASRNRPEKDLGMLLNVSVAPGAVHTQRPVRFLLTDSKGLQYSVTGEELRWMCNSDAPKGAPTLNSSFVKPVAAGDTIQFVEGHGWGHGVGMCQWCAEAQAMQGQRYEQIVPEAYPGAVLVRAY